MKLSITILLLCFCNQYSFAQLNQDFGINFQAIARNTDGSILANKNITVRLSIREGSEEGAISYQEIKTTTTNIVGLFTIVLGANELNRIVVVGPFSNLNWTASNKYLQVEVDPNNSIVFSLLGIQKINFVPYAIHSISSEAINIKGIVPIEKGGTGVSSIKDYKIALGINNIDNTNDLNKPISVLQQQALNSKMNYFDTLFMYRKIEAKLSPVDTTSLSDRINFKENVLNKSVDMLADSSSDTMYPSVKAAKEYIDNKLDNAITYPIPLIKGGTGAITAVNARLNLGLVIGTDVLAQRTFGTAADKNIADFEPAIANGLTTQYLRGDKTWQILNFEPAIANGLNTQYLRGDKTWQTLNFEPVIANGLTTQFLRGDKTWQTLNTDAITEGTNLFFSNDRSRNAISLTNVGTNGAATYDNSSGVLNIPTYSLTGLGGESPLTFSTGLTRTTNTITVNTTQNILKLTNLTANGFIKTSGGDGTLTVDNTNYLSANENITLSGDITGSGTNSITTTIGNSKVTNTMLAGSIDLSTKVTNVLPVSNGGTGMNSLSGILLGNATGSISAAAYGSFCDLTQQTAAVINTPYPMQLNTTELSENVTIQNNLSGNKTRITVLKAGKYNLQFSAQINRVSGTAQADVSIWLRKNGIDVPNTCTDLSITGSTTTTAPTVAAWNFMQNMAAGDYLELIWSTTNITIEITYEGVRTSPNRPAIPSLILTMQQVY